MRPYGPTPWHYTKMQTRTMGGLSGSIWLAINKVKVKWVSLAVSHTIYTSDALTLEPDRREHHSKARGKSRLRCVVSMFGIDALSKIQSGSSI